MRKLLAVCLAPMFLLACAQGTTTDAEGPALVKVNNTGITEKDVRDEIKMLPREVMEIFGEEDGVEFLLNELAKKEMLYQEALKKGYRKRGEFRDRLEVMKKRLMVEMLLEDEIEKSSRVSDQEVRDFYEQNKQRFIAEVPGNGKEQVMEFEVVRDAIHERLSMIKQKNAFEEYIASLREKYTVEINKEATEAAFGNGPASLGNAPTP
jgi:peptidyl-prolyl cis-trans isomerase C